MPYVLIIKLLTMFRNMVSEHILKTKRLNKKCEMTLFVKCEIKV